MEDLISRCALFNSCANAQDKADVFAAIQAAPVVAARPEIRAKWVEGRNGYLCCSHCSKTKPYQETEEEILYWSADFCPGCGAIMKG